MSWHSRIGRSSTFQRIKLKEGKENFIFMLLRQHAVIIDVIFELFDSHQKGKNDERLGGSFLVGHHC
ncbi:hypothetical protein Sjap_005630 [Stephania japonica]|uniref:Uncharacterized protein n=1 Tax=Stephania japonica TaxID=461633 RepID=A0AAP0K6U7_9MAGN